MNPDSLALSRFALWPLAQTVAAMIVIARVDDATLEPWAQSQRPLLLAADLFAAGFIFLA